jgi:hypothetical protein
MRIINAKLSGEAKAKAMLTRTEGLNQNLSQGQSVDRETAKQNIIDPRVRVILIQDEKVRRYSDESLRSRIKNLVQHMTKVVCDMLYGVVTVFEGRIQEFKNP